METVLVCIAVRENLVFLAQYLRLDEWGIDNLRSNLEACESMNQEMVVKFIKPRSAEEQAVHVYTTMESFDQFYDHGPYAKFEFIPAIRK